MQIRELHIVPAHTANVRMGPYLQKLYVDRYSKKVVAKALKRGQFLLDGQPAGSGIWISPGQTISWIKEAIQVRPNFERQLDVIFEDEEMAVVVKPAGLEVSGNRFHTVERALPHNLTKSNRKHALFYPLPVHRLDYATRGLLLIAKTTQSQQKLGNDFASRRITKHYQALVKGKINSEGQVDFMLDNKAAFTTYRVSDRSHSLHNAWISLIDIYPITGRYHQIRRHCQMIGHPIVGDRKYDTAGQVRRGKGLFLCAVGLSLDHPITGEKLSFQIESPTKFRSLMKQEEKRWLKYHRK